MIWDSVLFSSLLSSVLKRSLHSCVPEYHLYTGDFQVSNCISDIYWTPTLHIYNLSCTTTWEPNGHYKVKIAKAELIFFNFNFYCYSVTVVCLFSPSLHPTPANPTSLPCLHPPPWFCPCVFYSSSCNPLSLLSPPHSPLIIVVKNNLKISWTFK